MDRDDPNCPVRRQVVPQMDEMDDDFDILSLDPLEELAHSPVKNLVHNYHDRVAFWRGRRVRGVLPVLPAQTHGGRWRVRHEQNRAAAGHRLHRRPPRNPRRAAHRRRPDDFKRCQPRMDPLRLRAIPHVELIRIGTRFPVLNPYRFTPEFCEMIGKYHPVWINTHYNHPKELTADAALACDRITRAGAPLGNQTVLLKGINNDAEVFKNPVQESGQNARPAVLPVSGPAHRRHPALPHHHRRRYGPDGAVARSHIRFCHSHLCAGHAPRKGSTHPQRVQKA